MQPQIKDISMCPNAQFLIMVTYGNDIVVADVTAKERRVHYLKSNTEENYDTYNEYSLKVIEWSKGGRYVAFGFGDNRNNNGVEIWDTTNWKKIREKKGFATYVRDIAWSPDSQHIALINLKDNTIRVLETNDMNLAKSNHGFMDESRKKNKNGLAAVDWSWDGKYIVTGNPDGIFEIFDAKTMQSVKVIKNRGVQKYTNLVRKVLWNRQRDKVAIIETEFGSNVKIWNAHTWQLLQDIRVNPERPVKFINWDASGKYLATMINDYGRDANNNRVSVGGDTVKIFDSNTGSLKFSQKIAFPEAFRWFQDTTDFLVVDKNTQIHPLSL